MSKTPVDNEFKTSITATLSVRDWERADAFYRQAFGAVQVYQVEGGGVSRLAVDGAEFWVAEESPAHQNYSPPSLGGCSVRMLLIAEDPQALFDRALAHGARPIAPIEEAHGWRLGRIEDPFGHHWEVGRPLS